MVKGARRKQQGQVPENLFWTA